MKVNGKFLLIFTCIFSLLFLPAIKAAAAKAEKKSVKEATGMRFENFPDMSDFDPSNPVIPTGDTIKIAIVASFSGPAAMTGQLYFISTQWAAHAINKKGGILVDGKKKLIEVIKADHMANPAACKKLSERMVLQEKVDFMIGSDGSHYQKIINETAGKYKIIAVSA